VKTFQFGVLMFLFFISINTIKEPDFFKSLVITATLLGCLFMIFSWKNET